MFENIKRRYKKIKIAKRRLLELEYEIFRLDKKINESSNLKELCKLHEESENLYYEYSIYYNKARTGIALIYYLTGRIFETSTG